MIQRKSTNSLFRKTALISIVAVYFLILVGGIVRSTGSGMGCPDWPKCFGKWVPPTDVSQLPENYKEVYSEKRIKKNEKLASYLRFLGYEELAYEVQNDDIVKAETNFNTTKTWIEYINRLVGAVIGLLVIITLYVSKEYIGNNNSIFILSLFIFFLVLFQGWIGSLVVSTNLLPWMVSIHMLLALVIIGLLIFVWFKSGIKHYLQIELSNIRLINTVLVLCIFAIIVQILLGTQVREAIDVIALSFNYGNRELWINELGGAFYFHRSFSILIMFLHLYLVYILLKNGSENKYVLNLAKILLVLVIFEIASGVIMAYWAIPSVIQPIHLLLSTLIFGAQFYLILILNFSFAGKGVLQRSEI